MAAPRLKKKYQDEILPKLKEQLGYKSVMALPRITKIVLNMSDGTNAIKDKKTVDVALADLEKIAGQKPVITKARKSIAGFKVREGWPLGCKVTLRGNRMYEFLDRLVSVAIPRVRDFRGLSPKSFDGQVNYSLGIQEQIVFPEIDYDKIDKIRGLDITVCTTAKTNEEGRALLKAFHFPIKES